MEFCRSEFHSVKTQLTLPRYGILWFAYVGFCLDDVASSQDGLENGLLGTEVGVKRDVATVDRTTNLLNHLLYKVQNGACL